MRHTIGVMLPRVPTARIPDRNESALVAVLARIMLVYENLMPLGVCERTEAAQDLSALLAGGDPSPTRRDCPNVFSVGIGTR